MNDETVERIARNEALFRFANEERDRLVDEAGLEELLLVCECGHPWCHEMICVTPADYQRVRARSDQFFVIPGHEIPDVEFVEASGRGAKGQFLVVAKRPGLSSEVAKETDPRG